MGDLTPGRTPIARSLTRDANRQRQTVTNEPSEWTRGQFNTQSQGILDTIERYNTQSPYQAYTGPLVAGMTDNERRAADLVNENVGANDGILGEAENLIRRGADTNVRYRTFDEFDPNVYYNPFEQEVVDAAGAYYDEQLGRQIADNQSRATMSGAYGGSRHGVADSELRRTSQMDRAKMMADLRYRGYEDARGQFNTDSAGLYAADTANRDNLYRGADQFEQLAANRTADWTTQAQALADMGATEREIEQARLDADKAQFDAAAADRLQRFLIELETRRGILGSTPGGSVQTTQGMTAGEYINGAGTVMSSVGSIMGGIGGMMGSDRRLKRDVVLMGQRGPYNWYAFNYIWEPEDAAPHQGVMAQEVVTVQPAAVFNMGGGYLGVNYDMIEADIARSERQAA